MFLLSVMASPIKEALSYISIVTLNIHVYVNFWGNLVM